MKKIYLDYAATTPIDARVARAMEPYGAEQFGNPGSLHSMGQVASRAVYRARRDIATSIGAHTEEILFTASATEANNLALRGVVKRARLAGVRHPHIVVSAIEHESVLETARDLEREGVRVSYIPVSRAGVVQLEELKKALTTDTVLVSVMYANNEVGTIEPIAKIAKLVQGFRVWGIENRVEKENTLRPSGYTLYPLLHTDAAQALPFLDCSVSIIGVDLMTLSSHKVYGPKGVGALYVKGSRVQGIGARGKKANANPQKNTLYPSSYTLSPVITGGGQEFGLRSGTENVAGIVGFAEAVRIAIHMREKESKRIAQLRDVLWKGITVIYPSAKKNTPVRALPNNLNVWFPGKNAHDLLIALDMAGIAASAGSACAARKSDPSYVLKALAFSEKRQRESIRFSLGRNTTKQELRVVLRNIKKIITL